jgi:hypothetical protein
MQDRIKNIALPLDIIQSQDMIDLIKTNGFITFLKYCENIVYEHSDEVINGLIANGYIISVMTSEKLNMSIGVSRKGLVEYHKKFENVKLAKVFSTKYGYVAILGKTIEGVNRFFIGDKKLWNAQISKIEEFWDERDVSQGNVSPGNTYNNISSIEPNIFPDNKIKIKKIKKLKEDKEKDSEGETKQSFLEQMDKASKKVKKSSDEYQGAIEKRKESLTNPSKKKIYQKYKSCEIEDWNCEDFLGYYLNEFVAMMNMEDTDFVNCSRSTTKNLLMNMGKFKSIYFSKSNEDFKGYIKWCMEYINSSESWITSPVSIYNIVMGNLSKKLVKEYLTQKTKKKVIKNRMQTDVDYSDADYWKQKYLEQ